MSDILISKTLDRHENQLNCHEKRLGSLEKSDEGKRVSIANICEDIKEQNKKIGGLIKAIWGLISTVLFTLIGFVLWYIQGVGK